MSKEKKSQLVNIDVKDIYESQTNPRKHFSKHDLTELSDSIKSQGLIQPIVVREKKVGLQNYEVVCGSRRLKASVLAGLESIPCVVRELTDEEAFDLQITENLQRRDVHPIEEAQAFKILIDSKKYNSTSLALRFGKSNTYVVQRLQLINLIPEFQTYFFDGKMIMSQAIIIARLPKKDQKEFFEGKVKAETNFSTLYTAAKLNEQVQAYMLSLKDALFDLTKDGIIKGVCACTSCPKNSAVNTLLFPELVDNPTCSDRSCFNQKNDVALNELIDKHLNGEGVHFIHHYGNQEFVNQLKEKGVKILRWQDINFIDEPELDDEPKIDNYNLNQYDSLEAMQEDFDDDHKDWLEEKEQYEKEMIEYKEKLADPNICTGYYISNVGTKLEKQYFYFRDESAENSTSGIGALVDKNSEKVSTKKSRGKIEIEAEIMEVEARKKKAIKSVYAESEEAIQELFEKEKIELNELPLTESEETALFISLYNHLDDDQKEIILKDMKLDKNEHADKYSHAPIELYSHFEKYAKDSMFKIMRMYFYSDFGYTRHDEALYKSMENLAAEKHPEQFKEIQQVQNVKLEPKQKSFDKQLATLKAELESIGKPKVVTEKKAVEPKGKKESKAAVEKTETTKKAAGKKAVKKELESVDK
jgi:ParB/RepB/Spo0J family partition protein